MGEEMEIRKQRTMRACKRGKGGNEGGKDRRKWDSKKNKHDLIS